MRTVDPFLAELEHEAVTTRRLLEHVPEEKYSWRPHERAFSLGELAWHVAGIPGGMAELLGGESFDMGNPPDSFESAASKTQLLAEADESTGKAQAWLNSLDEEAAAFPWRLMKGDQELMTIPRAAAIRSFMFNHLYHHRGQLSTYLRIAGERVPSVYGPTADENPFE